MRNISRWVELYNVLSWESWLYDLEVNFLSTKYISMLLMYCTKYGKDK